MLFNNMFFDGNLLIGLNYQEGMITLKVIASRTGKIIDSPTITGSSLEELPSGRIVVRDENGLIVYMTN